jgi:hypothetical protein
LAAAIIRFVPPAAGAVTLAHPLLDPGGLHVPPISAAVVAMLVVTAVARLSPGPGSRSREGAGEVVFSWTGSLKPWEVAVRVVGVALLGLAILAGRLGSERELANVAPALVVGAGWALLILGSALLGPLWRWLDPWDALARPLAPTGQGAGDVRWAIVPAGAWAWYLSAYPTPLHPRSVGLALAVYTIVTLAGCLALGRNSWLSRAEPFGLLFGWTSLLGRGGLSAWRPPRGAEAVLGVLAGGLAFGAIRRSALWGGLNVDEHALLWATAGVAVLAGAFGGLLWWLSRRAQRVGAPGSSAAAAVPAVGGIALALALSSNRLFTSVQLLPGLLLDPFGTGGGPLAGGYPLDADPLGRTGLVVAQVAVLLVGHVAGAIVLARREPAERRQPGMLALAASTGVGILALTAPQA